MTITPGAGKGDPDHRDRWRCDVLVVGAGPAGTATAIEANRRGLTTVVVDKARFPREKCCGDGLTASALRHLDDLGLDPGALPSWIPVGQAELWPPHGRPVHLPLPERRGLFAAVCRRSELDAALVTLARHQGVTVLENHELTDLTLSQDRVVAQVNDIEFTADYLVAADGMWSPTRKLLGATPARYRGEWHAFRQYFTNVSPSAARRLVVWFEPDLVPGYAWSFPLGDGSANVGFGIRRDRDQPVQSMGRLWSELLQRPHIADFLGPDATPEAPHRAWPIPARIGALAPTAGRVLFVGDAAAATDPLTGEGIGQALETGRLAAQAIGAGGQANPAMVTATYRRSLAGGLVPDHRLAGALSAVMANPWLASAAVAATGATGWTRRQFARWLFEDYPRALVFTPRRWARRAMSRPGAFTRTRPACAPDVLWPQPADVRE